MTRSRRLERALVLGWAIAAITAWTTPHAVAEQNGTARKATAPSSSKPNDTARGGTDTASVAEPTDPHATDAHVPDNRTPDSHSTDGHSTDEHAVDVYAADNRAAGSGATVPRTPAPSASAAPGVKGAPATTGSNKTAGGAPDTTPGATAVSDPTDGDRTALIREDVARHPPQQQILSRDPSHLQTAKMQLGGLLDRSVRSLENGEVGRVIDVMTGDDGRPAALELDVGGFLGVGNRRIAVAWSLFDLSRTGQNDPLRVALSAAQVRSAPAMEESGEVQVVTGAAPVTAGPVAPAGEGSAPPAAVPATNNASVPTGPATATPAAPSPAASSAPSPAASSALSGAPAPASHGPATPVPPSVMPAHPGAMPAHPGAAAPATASPAPRKGMRHADHAPDPASGVNGEERF